MNMLKSDSLYNQGMKVLIYSTKRADFMNISWRREGTNIAYYKNCIKRIRTHYYTLSFEITAQCISLYLY